jgi:N-acetylglucosaminyl-diphospho-decaprenol L-rhamnosyltransferase
LITISLVSHRQSHLIAALLSDIQRIMPTLISEIIIVHNDGDDRSKFPSNVAGIPVIHVLNLHRRGFGANHNAAFELSTQPFFAVLNPDLRIENDPFEVLLNRFEVPSVGLIAPKILNPNGSIDSSARRLYSPREIVHGALSGEKNVAEPDWLAGMFMMFRREAFVSVRGFDESYFMYVEDVDICARISLAGWTLVYEQFAEAIHDARRANRRSARHFWWHSTSALRWWFGPIFWKYRAFLRVRSKLKNNGA